MGKRINRILKNKRFRRSNGYTKREWNLVLFLSMLLTGIVVFVGIVYPKRFSDTTTSIFNVIIDKLSPLYLILMLGVFIFSLYLAFSKYGNIKLGRPNDGPEFSNMVWFSMLFGVIRITSI